MKKKYLIIIGIFVIIIASIITIITSINSNKTKNTDTNLIKDNGFILKNIEIIDKEKNILKFDIKNTNNEDMKNLSFSIIGFDERSNIIFTHTMQVDEIKSNDTYQFNDKVTGDLSNVISYKLSQAHFMTTG